MRRTCARGRPDRVSVPRTASVQQLVVRDAAPQEERQPRRQVEVAEPIRPCRGRLERVRGLAFDAEQEAGAARIRRSPRWMPASKPPSARPACRNRAASAPRRRSPAADRRGARASTGCVVAHASSATRASRRPADEDLPAARRVRRAAPALYGPPIEHGLDAGFAEVQLVGRAREAALRRLQHAFGFPELAHERHADLVRPAFTGTRTSRPASAVCM